MEITIQDKKELATIAEEAGEIANYKITSMAGLDEAKGKLKQVGEWQKMLKAKKEAITKPLNEALKSVRGLFAPAEDKLSEAERVLKTGILSYREVVAVKVEAKKEEIVAKVEEGKVDFEKAGQQIEKQEAKLDEFKTREIIKLEIFDANLIGREYLIPDEVAIKQALKDGKEVGGCRLVKETIIIK